MALSSNRKYYAAVIASYVIFQKNGKVLLSRRCNTGYHDAEYSLPAGHIEEGEFATITAIREAQEEVGVKIKPDDIVPAHIMHRHCGDHERIDFFFTVKKWTGEIINAEPDKCDEIQWFTFNKLPKNVIPYIRTALKHYRDSHFFSEFTETENKVF
jgi:8-oxo-dGTP diphosphatase